MPPEALKERQADVLIIVYRAFSTLSCVLTITWGCARTSLYPRLNITRLQRFKAESLTYLAQGAVKRNPGLKETMPPEALKERQTNVEIIPRPDEGQIPEGILSL